MREKLSERDVCTQFITPAIQEAGWENKTQMREEVPLTDGRIVGRNGRHTRKKPKRADYILYYKPNIPIAVVEAKDKEHSVGSGMQQALDYAEMLDVPFVFSSNGDEFLFHDRTGYRDTKEQLLAMNEFPSPEDLWSLYKQEEDLGEEEAAIMAQDYYRDASGKEPRYYQLVAINRTIEAIAKGQNRLLLVMATGTGKTYTAFQIIWRLWKARKKKRILFLADRNILVDQAKSNDFKPFRDKITKVQHRTVDKSYEIYMALYQGISGVDDAQNIYKQFSPDFFDLIVIDECHRGSASEDSAWREILSYFSNATHIGLTATPKETKEVSNTNYFGDPIYTYSLKQGIEDGFLAPYRVIRYTLDKDVDGWRPTKGQKDRYGQEIEDRVYNQKDFDKNLIIDDRTKEVAKTISAYLKKTGRYQKTIVFCTNIDHAERMRQALVNEHPEEIKKNRKYVMRITGDDDEGKRELDNFIDPSSTYPVIAITSKLMTTGVDAQTCKLIVLETNINSITEFKQIIGRGTRVKEAFGKYTFTIMDFRHATRLFADPGFDGVPENVYEPRPEEPLLPPEEGNPGEGPAGTDNDDFPGEQVEEEGPSYGPRTNGPPGGEEDRPRVYTVDGVNIRVLNEQVQYIGEDGSLITESLKDYTKHTVQKEYASLAAFLQRWHEADRKEAVIEEMREHGLLLDALEEEVGENFDPFDLICHVAFDQSPLTRNQRAKGVKQSNYFTKYGYQAQQVLATLLEKYEDDGLEDMESLQVLKLPEFQEHGSLLEIIQSFGSKEAYQQAVLDLEDHLYQIEH